MSRIYLASSWRNTYQEHIVSKLRANGHQVYDFKNPPSGVKGFAWSELDPDWEKWTTNDYVNNIQTHWRAAQGFMNDQRGMEWADTCVLLLPCGKSAHLEAGWMAGRGKHTVIYIPEGITHTEPELMYLLAHNIVTDFYGLLDSLK